MQLAEQRAAEIEANAKARLELLEQEKRSREQAEEAAAKERELAEQQAAKEANAQQAEDLIVNKATPGAAGTDLSEWSTVLVTHCGRSESALFED